MEANNREQPILKKDFTPKSHKKNWRDYLSESTMIIFSVLLALVLSEFVNSLHEKQNTKAQLKSIVNELERNKQALQEMHVYNLQVLQNIDSALNNIKFQKTIVSNEEFHLNLIAPRGVLFRYLDNEAWSVAKNNNIISKIDIQTATLLTKIYEDQERITKIENEVAKIILDRASRDPNQTHVTLMLIKDVYHGWAVDRTPGLISQIENVVKKLNN